MDYRNEIEKNYYGSDYNKFLRECCRKNMTVINIDCLQWDYKKGILRIVESKHWGERTKKLQREVLNLLSVVLGYCNSVARRMKFQVYIVIGNPPYKKIRVENLITGITSILYNNDVKKFSELELSP